MYRHDGPRSRPSTTVFCDNNNNNSSYTHHVIIYPSYGQLFPVPVTISQKLEVTDTLIENL